METFCSFIEKMFKTLLLHDENEHVTVAVWHSVHLKQHNKNFDLILNNILYSDRRWTVYGELKVISKAEGSTEWLNAFPFFFCESTETENNIQKE